MPFIQSKVNVKTTQEQQKELKTRLGQAIAIIPGKSESWLMVNLEDEQKMYFRGDDSEPLAFICVNCHGKADEAAFVRMTAELTKIYGEVLGIKPDHMYVKYDSSMYWGWNGTNF
ncbi:MAG: hypothetical protein IJI24_06405 [Lachnospiraceae bacterium]|nr:hypothetical protein [Lachnospiraceae bacterium]